MRDLVNIEPSESLLEGRRYLEWLSDDCVILEDYTWSDGDKWLLKMKLKNKGMNSEFIPIYSDWYVFIDKNYPYGKIEFYPSKANGISCVFPHQSPRYLSLEVNTEYYQSKLCLEQYSPTLKVNSYAGNVRLYDYVQHALKWIENAANGILLSDGDYFETVAYPNKSSSKRVLYAESELTYKLWLNYSKKPIGLFNSKSGDVNLGQNKFLYITDFYEGITGYKNDNAKILCYSWGNHVLDKKTEEKKGIWVKLQKMPYIVPWEAPKNWPDLIKIFAENKLNFYEDIMPFLNNLRDQQSHILLLGFPISKKVNGIPCELNWQAIELPLLSDYSTPERYFKGFRKTVPGFEIADIRRFFSKKNLPLEWVETNNWYPDNIVSRGNLPASIKRLKCLFVGVGALGSMIVEMLVRSGLVEADIVDRDYVEMGNLTRHTLTAKEIDMPKATSIEEKLSNSFIHYKGHGYNLTIEEFIHQERARLREYDVIFETTGNNDVLRILASENLDCVIFSISVGLFAKRMYINSQNGRELNLNKFNENLNMWLTKDESENLGIEYPRDGLGCWHPLFPARVDHLSLLASSAISIIENDLIHSKENFTVIERGELGSISIQERKEIINEN